MPLSTARGVALYVGALLGPGLLVLPGLAVTLAGPASILAWASLLVLSGLVAIVFARLGGAYPSTGGVAHYARIGLGQWAGNTVAWCFLAGIVTGTPVVCMMGVGYLTSLLGVGRAGAALAAAVLLAALLLLSSRDLHTSTTIQLGLVAFLLVLIVTTVGSAVPASDAANWTPFAPHGWSAIGAAASTLMLSFVGWEAIAPLTGRFGDPVRQLPKVVGIAFVLTSVVYLGLAATTVAALGSGSEVPLADLLALGLGRAGPALAAGGAIVLTLGAVNAYLTGGIALAQTRTPYGGKVLFLGSVVLSGLITLGLIAAGVVDVAAVVTVPSTFFLVVYLGCTVAAARLTTGRVRLAAMAATVVILVILAFAGYAVLPALFVAAVASVTSVARKRAGRPAWRGTPRSSPLGTAAAEPSSPASPGSPFSRSPAVARRTPAPSSASVNAVQPNKVPPM